MSGREYTWAEAEKLGAVIIAMRDGVPEASRQLGVPVSTINTWLVDVGVGVEVRALANARAALAQARAKEALSKAVTAVCEEVVRRKKARQ